MYEHSYTHGDMVTIFPPEFSNVVVYSCGVIIFFILCNRGIFENFVTEHKGS